MLFLVHGTLGIGPPARLDIQLEQSANVFIDIYDDEIRPEQTPDHQMPSIIYTEQAENLQKTFRTSVALNFIPDAGKLTLLLAGSAITP